MPVFACAVLGIVALAGGAPTPQAGHPDPTVAPDCHPAPAGAPPTLPPQPAPWSVSCPPPPQSAGAWIKLERLTCYGSCPAYSIEIHGDGQATFYGDAYVNTFGRVPLHLKKPAVDALFAQAACAHPDEWKHAYSARGTDEPTARVTIALDGARPITVTDYPPCHWGDPGRATPGALCELEHAIDDAFDRDRFLTCKAPNGNPTRCQSSATPLPRPSRDLSRSPP